MNILITGGSGFIGSYLIKYLISTNEEITSLYNIDIEEPQFKDPKLINLEFDIRRQIPTDFIDEKISFELCIHLAALCKEPGYEWDEYFNTNHQGTINVIELCNSRGIGKILFTSTMMVHKAADVKRMENSITSPDTAYGISKLLAEKELISWKKQNSANTLKIIRPAVVFGRGENANFKRLYESIKKGFFPYVGRSSTIKSSIYIKELVYFFEFLLHNETENDLFNMSFPEELSIREIVGHFKCVFQLKAVNPVLPYHFLIAVSYIFEFANGIGLKNSIHHRRIQKLYNSSNIYPSNALREGYKFKYAFKQALEDWKMSDESLT